MTKTYIICRVLKSSVPDILPKGKNVFISNSKNFKVIIRNYPHEGILFIGE